jgi:hypothetical protein
MIIEYVLLVTLTDGKPYKLAFYIVVAVPVSSSLAPEPVAESVD